MSHLPGVLFFWKDPERPIDMILLQSDQSKSFGKEEHLCYWEIRLTGIAEDIILSFSLTLRFSSNQYSFTTLTTMEGVPYTSWVHANRLKIAKSDDFDHTWYYPTPAHAQMRRDLALDSSSALLFSLVDSSGVDRGLSTVSGGGDVGHYFDESVKSEDS
ncbi:hypothetical protein PHYBLDRAFT_166950 [Phycomyces blakesleeanus NRRL 1555(-)]|uniref:Uncharacterized protein n=1 Tax=Phycomyces blakesleeanus (strain ATCC 8743b / DSM 1359 / FGSC 10004 / NBRC 33097 / NRRL 1555) TaxID=763407 RepID=A0A167ND92_PHYB8|nr:hypothetical protein PHYBLDRAFT_166950 [Phycomyces blakesleeanus NRRL 1555(-)]OAD75724.1 hypothetical protein PHYBLDRAFT_166950 [Phycomyces blakesleeanus NRRL 1555(-)]|eukprot:XP_018293764.1 hypothetical protein PHYBLDRAFT_166950 [Phycomyces blakesleeanus NRRL 1555(-)]